MPHKGMRIAMPRLGAGILTMQDIRNIILDRDGTVIVDKHYLSDPAGVELIPDAGPALGRLAAAGRRLYLATNQSGIGRGYFSEADQHAVQARLEELLAAHAAPISGLAFCPHAPQDNCSCRKPATGLWDALSAEHGLEPDSSVMVGDKPADVSLGLNAGLAASVLVLTGKGVASAEKLGLPELPEGEPWLELAERREGWPHVLARDLAAACDWILSAGRNRA